MRGTFVGVVLAVAVSMALPGAATASHDPSGAPFDEDFVVGFAGFFPPCCTATIDAHSGPLGENPTGMASFGERATFFGGPVTCLTVTGNRAVMGGPSGFAGPAGYLFVVEDNAATGTPDSFRWIGTLPDTPSSCPADLALESRLSATSGDLVVHDAQPLPTTKDQCKNGGWRNYPQFQNKVQCVLFVVRSCGQLGRFEPKPKNCPVRLPNR